MSQNVLDETVTFSFHKFSLNTTALSGILVCFKKIITNSGPGLEMACKLFSFSPQNFISSSADFGPLLRLGWVFPLR